MTNDMRSKPVLSEAAIGRHASALPKDRSLGQKLSIVMLTSCSVVVGLLSTTSTASASATAASVLQSPQSTAERQIVVALQKTRTSPGNPSGWIDLGRAYTLRAYETGDSSFYPLAETAFNRAAKISAQAPDLFVGKASLALARHEFAEARKLALVALSLQPTSFDAKVALVDANIELGRYDEASEQVDALVDQRAGVASLSRLSYVYQLRGDLYGAESAMRSAVAAAPPRSFEQSVALGYLGEVLLERGKGPAAMRAFKQALEINPSSGVAGLGIASMQAESSDPRVVKTIETLSERMPLPAVFGFQADVERAARNVAGERIANQLVDASVKLYQANGAVVDSELAILLADRGARISANEAVVLARKAYAERRTIFTNDALGWSLFQAGDITAALPFMSEAVARKPAVASVRWHAAAVFAANGDMRAAKVELLAASANRWFSPTQRKALLSLSQRLGA
jgi:tetratricopeptide (TPR) repeat protein